MVMFFLILWVYSKNVLHFKKKAEKKAGVWQASENSKPGYRSKLCKTHAMERKQTTKPNNNNNLAGGFGASPVVSGLLIS